MITSTCMTTSTATFMASIGKKKANILGISIKQLLIPNSDFSLHICTHSNTFSDKKHYSLSRGGATDLLWSECLCNPKFICWNTKPHVRVSGGGVFGRCLGQQGGALIRGVSALIKEMQQGSLASPFHQMRIEWEVVSLQPDQNLTKLALYSLTSSL